MPRQCVNWLYQQEYVSSLLQKMMRKVVGAGFAVSAIAASLALLYAFLHRKESARRRSNRNQEEEVEEISDLDELDARIYELAIKYSPLAIELLKQMILIPSEHIGNDSKCGESNHENPRLEFLRNKIIELGAVYTPQDVDYDSFGNLVWAVTDPEDQLSYNERKVIYLDGHVDTFQCKENEWMKKIGKGIDCYKGLIDQSLANVDYLREELGYIPDKSKWNSLVFGRGSVDQLQGLITQVIATKILLETRELGSLSGAIVVSVATIAKEENPGGAPMNIMRKQILQPHQVPDCVILTQGTGDLAKGPCGIYIGEKGHCQIDVDIEGRSCCGAMPQYGLNPLEYGSLLINDAVTQALHGFGKHPLLGNGSRTTTSMHLVTPSNCSVPTKFGFKFMRTLLPGQYSDAAIQEIKSLKSYKKAIQAGCKISLRIPNYAQQTWKGALSDNPVSYLGWATEKTNPVVKAALESYKRTVTPHVPRVENYSPDELRRYPRIGSFMNPTDGVGYPLDQTSAQNSIEGKNWISVDNKIVHPPMFGIGAGYEQHSHKVGEYVHSEHIWCPIAVISRFPSLFVKCRTHLTQ